MLQLLRRLACTVCSHAEQMAQRHIARQAQWTEKTRRQLLQGGFIRLGRTRRLYPGRGFAPQDLFRNGEPGAHYETYDPQTLLRRRNQLTYSSQFSNPAWTKTAASIGASDGIGVKVVEDTTTAAHLIRQDNASLGAAGVTTYRLKAAERAWARIQLGSAGAYFNLAAGTIGTISPGWSASITAAGNGYYDCTVSVPSANSNACLVSVTTGDGVVSYTGDGTSGIYLARAQLEWNTTAPSAYQDVTDWNTEYLAAAGGSVHMWQDSARTLAAYAVEQPVGCWDDLSGNGHNATQSGSTKRPMLSARVNLLTKTEQWSDPAWSKVASGTGSVPTATDNYAVAPDGTTTAARIQANKGAGSTTGDYSVVQQSLSITSSAVVGYLWVKSNTGSAQTAYIRTVGDSVVPVPTAWTKITLTGTSATPFFTVGVRGGSGSDSSIDILVWHPDLRTSDDAAKNIPAYQRVNTASDFDTDGFPEYERLDGVDDNQTAAAGGGGTTGFLFCGAAQCDGAGTSRVLWSDMGTNTGYRVMVNSSNQLQLTAGDGATSTSVSTVDTVAALSTHVFTAWDDGVNLNVQIDNGAVASVARPAVAAGTSGFTIGSSNGAASGYFKGRIYSQTYRQSDGGDGLRAKLKRYHAAKAAITI